MRKIRSLLFLFLFFFAWIGHHYPAHAAQFNPVLPTSSPYPGLTMLGNINSAFQGILSNNSGATAPSYGIAGSLFADTTHDYFQLYSGSNWLTIGTFTSTAWSPLVNGVPFTCPVSTGSANAYVVAYAPVLASYVSHTPLCFTTNFANTGTATVNFGPGAITIKKLSGTALSSGDLASGAVVQGVYDGTSFQLTSEVSQASSGTVSSVTCGTGLAGGTITATGTCSFATVATGNVLANVSGSTAVPTATPISSLISVNAPQGRLTLTTATPVMSADVASGATLFYDAYVGNTVPYYNGSSDVSDTIAAGEVSTAMAASGTGVLNASGVFDVWWIHAGANHICVATNGSGGGWASDTAGSNTARGTGYSQLDRTTRPYITNKNSITHCYNGATDYGAASANQATYLGTIYTVSAGHTGMTFRPSTAAGGSANILGVFNGYNRVRISTIEGDSNGSWTSTTTWQVADGNTNNSIRYVDGLAQVFITADEQGGTLGSGGWSIGINFDSTTATPTYQVTINSTINVQAVATDSFPPALGFHTVYPMIFNNVTWNGAPYYSFRAIVEM